MCSFTEQLIQDVAPRRKQRQTCRLPAAGAGDGLLKLLRLSAVGLWLCTNRSSE